MRLNTDSKFYLLFRSLRHRNFRLFFIGQSISLIGTWMQLLAVSWLVWRMSHDPFLLGLVPFIGRLPTLFLAPLVGALVDRWDRHRLVTATQVLSMLQTLTADDKRGRVMSFYSMAFQGMVPLGALLSGGMASWIGAPWTVILGGLCCILGAIVFYPALSGIR